MKTMLRLLAVLALSAFTAFAQNQSGPVNSGGSVNAPVSQLLAGTGISLSPTNGRGTVTVTATGAPPTGAAGGVLSGTYPNPGFISGNATATEWTFPSTLTNGLQLYNTVDQVTNYERLGVYWSSNQLRFAFEKGGTGTNRALEFASTTSTVAGNKNSFRIMPPLTGSGTGGMFDFQNVGSLSGVGAMTFMSLNNPGGAGWTNTAGAGSMLSILPIYNQASGAAANTDFKIARVETVLGSGAQRFAEFFAGAAGTTSLFSIVNNGHVLLNGLTADGTGALQFAAATTSAGGITFGTDVNFYRAGTANLFVSASANAKLTVAEGATSEVEIQGSGGNAFISASNPTGTMSLRTNGTTTALTLDSSQGATFAAKAVSTSATAGIGYATGAGGTVTQATDKTTGVTLSKVSGQITMNAASLAAGTSVGFTVTNTTVATTDVVIVNIDSTATLNSYTVTVDAVGAGSFHIHLRNESAGALAEAVVLNFAVIKAVSS